MVDLVVGSGWWLHNQKWPNTGPAIFMPRHALICLPTTGLWGGIYHRWKATRGGSGQEIYSAKDITFENIFMPFAIYTCKFCTMPFLIVHAPWDITLRVRPSLCINPHPPTKFSTELTFSAFFCATRCLVALPNFVPVLAMLIVFWKPEEGHDQRAENTPPPSESPIFLITPTTVPLLPCCTSGPFTQPQPCLKHNGIAPKIKKKCKCWQSWSKLVKSLVKMTKIEKS